MMSDAAVVKAILDSIEQIEERQRALGAEKSQIYKEAKKAGVVTKALRGIVSERKRTPDPEVEAAAREYRIALGMALNDVADGASCREAAAKRGVSKTAVNDAVRREKKSEPGQSDDKQRQH
jgi:uncharacterized protein (UPF0335 family)